MRLIDADELTDRLNHTAMVAYPNLFPGLLAAVEVVEDTPTIEAKPVVHGRCNWCNGDYHTKIMATAIRYHTNGNMDGYELKVNFCPNCGAKMDGERKNNG